MIFIVQKIIFKKGKFMSNKNTNTNECTNATRILGPILPIYNKPIQHSINIYTVDVRI